MNGKFLIFVLNPLYYFSLSTATELLNNAFKLFEFRKFNACHKVDTMFLVSMFQSANATSDVALFLNEFIAEWCFSLHLYTHPYIVT